MLRPSAPADYAALLELMEDFNRGERIDMRREVTGPALQTLLGDPTLGRVIVDDQHGRLVGYAILTWGFDLEFGGRDAFLTELYVAPESRRTGRGLLLLNEVLRVAKSEGAGAVHLGVYAENEAALGLYRAAGFSRIPRDFYTRNL